MFDDIYSEISGFDIPVCLLGDFNCRTNTLNEIFDTEDHAAHVFNLDTAQENYQLDYIVKCGTNLQRSNQDTQVNNPGRELIDMCHCV